MSELPQTVHLPLPRTILAMPFRSLLLNTSVAYLPRNLFRFSFPRKVIAQLKAEEQRKKQERALASLAAEQQRLGLD